MLDIMDAIDLCLILYILYMYNRYGFLYINVDRLSIPTFIHMYTVYVLSILYIKLSITCSILINSTEVCKSE